MTDDSVVIVAVVATVVSASLGCSFEESASEVTTDAVSFDCVLRHSCAAEDATHPSTGETGSCIVVGDGVLLPRPQFSNPLATLVMYLLHKAFFTI